MILVIGTDDDPTTMYFINFLQEQHAPYLFLNQKFLLQGIEISNKTLQFFGKKYLLSDFSGVLNRLANVNFVGLQGMPIKYYRCFDVLNNIIDVFLHNVLNPGFLGFSNDSKLFQSISIKTNSIKIPKSYVLANLSIKQNLNTITKLNNHVIKSLSSIRSIVQHFESDPEMFADHSKEPVLFQELIDGINIRLLLLLGAKMVILKVGSLFT
ncbi:MAG: hypothetical protein RCO49_06630 [Rickettsia endosymbiont of Argas persicus]